MVHLLALAGLLGATAWALKLQYVYPEDVFEIHYTVEAIIIVLLGGAGTLLGPIVGGLIYGIFKYYLLKKRVTGTPLQKFII